MAVRFARDGCATGGGDDATGVNTLWRGVDLLFLPRSLAIGDSDGRGVQEKLKTNVFNSGGGICIYYYYIHVFQNNV